jgi:hypothetical protein
VLRQPRLWPRLLKDSLADGWARNRVAGTR